MSSPGCWGTEQELRDQQIKSESNNSTGRQDAGPSSCTTTNISSGSNSGAKSLIKPDPDEILYIKEEIIPDLRSERNQLDEKCIITEISSENNSGAKTAIKYDYDETLEIKEEPIQDQNIELNKKYESELCTLDTREANIITVEEPRTSKEKKLQEPKSELKKKYKCEKCARSYVRKRSLNTHKKFECGVMPQFRCELCGKQFKIKRNMNGHILRLHHKIDPKASQTSLNCNKCLQSYTCVESLRRHERLEHAAVRRQVTCHYCGYKTKQKACLSQHITSRHFQKFHLSVREKKYKCEKCGRSYFRETHFNHHKKYECDVIPQVSCESCGKKFKTKNAMNRHTRNVHQKADSKAPQMRHNCNKCSRSYSSISNLNHHKRLEHAAVKPQFICDYCGFETKRKHHLSTHITSQHLN